MRHTKLRPLGFRRRNSLNSAEISFGVGKLFDPLDLQAPVFVSNDVFDEDRFTGHLPDWGFHRVGALWGRVSGLVNAASMSVWGTNVKDDLAWGVRHGMDGQLRERLSHGKERRRHLG